MFLSDGDLRAAIESGRLIVNPPGTIGPTSIDLHLDSVGEAAIWDLDRLIKDNSDRGLPELQLNIARMRYGAMSREYLIPPPHENEAPETAEVVRREDSIIVRPGGFVLWQTREVRHAEGKP